MTLHKNLVFGVIDILNNIFNNNFFADKAIEKGLKSNKKWGSKDRGFIAETCYEIVRWKRLYTEIANVKHPFDSKKLKVETCNFNGWETIQSITYDNQEIEHHMGDSTFKDIDFQVIKVKN